MRRMYYDHEEAYRRIAAAGGRGWDDLACAVEDAARGAPGSYAALEEFLASSWCSPAPGATAIDLGCGGGQGSLMLARRGFQTTGVDYSPTAIKLARANAAAAKVPIALQVADCLHLDDVAANTFDLAIDNHTLHCLIGDDRLRFLAEAARVLKPGGVLFSETMSAEGEPNFERLGVDPGTRIDLHRTRYWVRRDELLDEFAAAGFDLLTIRSRRQPDDPYPGDTLMVLALLRRAQISVVSDEPGTK